MLLIFLPPFSPSPPQGHAFPGTTCSSEIRRQVRPSHFLATSCDRAETAANWSELTRPSEVALVPLVFSLLWEEELSCIRPAVECSSLVVAGAAGVLQAADRLRIVNSIRFDSILVHSSPADRNTRKDRSVRLFIQENCQCEQ